MVEDLETATRVQAVSMAQASNVHYTATSSPARNLAQAISDAIVLSSQARQVMNQLSQGKTVAEAWLDHVTAPPDLTRPDTPARSGFNANADADADSNGAASVKSALRATLGDLGWMLDAMHPPKVDANLVAQVLAQRMAVDNVGANPPLPEIRARADQSGTVAALYVENLSITVQKGTVTEAGVDRVALTTVDPSLRERVANADRPVVVDVGGGTQGSSAAQSLLEEAERRESAADGAGHALLILRQGGTTHPEGTMRLRLDALLPLG